MKKIIIFISISSLILLTTSCSEKTTNIEEVKEPIVNKVVEKVVVSGDKISVTYTGFLEDGTIFDSTIKQGGTPFTFTIGSNQVIKGWDSGLIGMKKGEKKTLEIEPKNAYGEYDKTKLQEVAITDLEPYKSQGFKLIVGEKLPTQFGELEIIKVTDEIATLDINHPLAGKKLIFEVELVKIN